ncbi:hypothetical protein SB751_35480, partial [Cupriavidus sp. SIMBA_020]
FCGGADIREFGQAPQAPALPAVVKRIEDSAKPVVAAIQGVALGGEWAGAVLRSMEHGKPDQRGRNASFTQDGPSCGTL